MPQLNNYNNLPVQAPVHRMAIKENIQSKELNKKSLEIRQSAVIIGSIGLAASLNMLVAHKLTKELPFEKVKAVCDNMIDTNKNLSSKGFSYLFWEEGKSKIVNTATGEDYTKWVNNQLKKSGFLSPDSNLAIVLKSRASEMIHELGHAISLNNIGKKWINTTKVLPYLTILLPIVALLPNKATDNKDSKYQFIKDKVNNNAGKIFFACFTPWLAEEFMATYRGLKATKKISPELLTPVSKQFASAFLTHALPIAGAASIISILPKFVNYLKLKNQLNNNK